MGWLNDLLEISKHAVGVLGTTVILVLIVLDVIAARDDVKGNTPREQVVELTQWGGWKLTGAWVPFGLGALLGHFFHPWTARAPFTHGVLGLGLVLALALACSLATAPRNPDEQKRGDRVVFYFVLLGMLSGVLLWPVGPFG